MSPLILRSTALAAAALVAVSTYPAQSPQTVAEKTDYRATSRLADVNEFLQELAKQSPRVRLGELGATAQGRKLPLAILADPPVATPEDAARSGKLVVLVIANIHAGEVDGKEGVLMLARDLATAKEPGLLKDLVVVICPDFNADGNEAIAKANRTEQNGPVEGVGRRENGQGFDLNRDFVKLESPEVRALVRAFNKWNPALFIDCHTTNGSVHQYTLTYDSPRHPDCDPKLVEAVRDRFLPEAGKRLKQATGFLSFFYGNFSRDRSRWETYPAEPRYGIQYVGLRNRIAVLSESYTYAPFRDRVEASREFVRACLQTAAERKDELKGLLATAAKPRDAVVLRTEPIELAGPHVVRGYAEEQRDGKRVLTGATHDYPVKYLGRTAATLTVPRPAAYLVPPTFPAVVENLQRHGVVVEELREDIELDVEAYRIDGTSRAQRPFQNHSLTLVAAVSRKVTRRVPAGTALVRTDQPLGMLAAFLLEPQSEDGLAAWNFFDAALTTGQDFPVLRLPAVPPLNAGRVRPLAEDRTMNKPITADLAGGGRFGGFGGRPVGGLTWLDDGEHFLQVTDGRLYKVQARSGRAEPFVDSSKLEKSLRVLPGLPPETAGRIARQPPSRMDPKHTGTLFEQGEDLYFARFDGSPAVRLTHTPGPKESATFSPDGKSVAFVRAGNLYVTDLATGTVKALTTDGGGAILNGKADWVYEEEVFNRHGKPFWWSPDSRWLAFLRFDDSPVHPFTVVDEVPVRQRVEKVSYPKAGDPNPKVTLGVVPAAGGEPAFPDLGDYSPGDSLLFRVGWMPDSERVFVYVMDRAQTWMDFCTATPQGGPLTRLFRETTRAWVDDPGDPDFLPDGSFLLASERSGWRHLYHFSKDGKLLGPVTKGEWEARAVHVVDAKGGWLYFTGTKDSHTGPNLYRCKLDGTGLARLSPGAGSHSATVSPTGSFFIDSHTDPMTPAQVRLYQGDGQLVRVLDTNPVYEREEYRFGPFERVQIRTPDGFTLEGTVVKPPDFDPNKRYPVWYMTYAGPHMPTVRDSWDGGRVQDQVIAGMGVVVFHCDPRSASGKGACSAWTAYRQLGVQELKDIECAIDWLCKFPWVDPKRIGMSGHSYGGYITAYALTHSTKFAAGVAGAPVTDWRNYDSVYTERYMNTPQENRDGYNASSVVRAAKNLHGRLLLLHGVMDDNVHVQNSLQLIEELQRADKRFETMFYPRARHNLGRGEQRLILEFIQRTVGNPSAPPEPTSRPEPSAPRPRGRVRP